MERLIKKLVVSQWNGSTEGLLVRLEIYEKHMNETSIHVRMWVQEFRWRE